MTALFDALEVWYDDQPRSGADNMAVDQLLVERIVEVPVLRVYHWSEPTVSFGYSLRLTEARKSFSDSELVYVRRWTGGGVVDHRADITYTLVVPRSHQLVAMRGADNYAAIHRVLVQALCEMGQDVTLVSRDLGDGDAACFLNPVAYDVVDSQNRKIAGAGQRRTRYGILHQGSLLADLEAEAFAGVFAYQLSQKSSRYSAGSDLLREAAQLARQRYGAEEWLRKR